MSHPHALTSLNPREAITDAVYRATLGFDHNDATIFNTAFVPDHESVTFDLNGTLFYGLHDIRTKLLDFVGPMDTTHMISNVRVDIKDGAETAQLNCYALAQHCPKGEGMNAEGRKYLAASEYWVDFAKGEEGWGIKKWVMKIIWTQGDASVLQRQG
jgi:SnoaL-like domain